MGQEDEHGELKDYCDAALGIGKLEEAALNATIEA